MHIHLGAAVLGLVVTGCDIALTMRREVQYIWKKPLRITFIRCLFVLMRYLPIALHIINVVLSNAWIDSAEKVSGEHCKSFLILQALAFSGMLVLLELILILRVFALYDRSRTIGIFLSLLFVFRNASSAYSIYDHVSAKIAFSNHCIPVVNLKDACNPVLVIIYGEFSIQLAIITLAMKRTVWDFRLYSHSVFSALNRDGLRVFGAIVVAMAATAATSVKKGATPYFFVFPLFTALVSSVGCHTILNLQKLQLELAGANGNSSEQKKDIELTTIGDVNLATWDAPWDARTFQMTEDDTSTGHERDASSLSSGEVSRRTVDRTAV
ncbi:hypothetical protein BDP27DRAFT_1451752 [Rhodocollybia butyracea]|uniref:DUF6533 domain-containing protein n=1 Tax=Rhodocollybia butyracea TaxID=206335 RepID=A0A9P5PFN9_9AGAR|nr:hypothetical protein BDP27DRAFT_1451752 [Rhodocollybia butyracea]